MQSVFQIQSILHWIQILDTVVKFLNPDTVISQKSLLQEMKYKFPIDFG